MPTGGRGVKTNRRGQKGRSAFSRERSARAVVVQVVGLARVAVLSDACGRKDRVGQGVSRIVSQQFS
jgi:hypothetical protein